MRPESDPPSPAYTIPQQGEGLDGGGRSLEVDKLSSLEEVMEG